MYNTDMPMRAELPTSRQLLRSTAIAAASAVAILVAVVLPSEYGIDPTGIGAALNLTEMGEIKVQLAEEAARDAAMDASAGSAPAVRAPAAAAAAPTNAAAAVVPPLAPPAPPAPPVPPAPERQSSLLGLLGGLVVSPALAQETRQDEMTFTLEPGQGIEIKMAMQEGAVANFAWVVSTGGKVNFDTHGDGGGRSISYEKGRGAASDEGQITAAFTGNHGWFWRNRGDAPVSVTLRTNGAYSSIERKV